MAWLSAFMQWNRRYVRRSYIRGSMWVVPLVALMIYAVFHRGVNAFGNWLVARGWASESVSFLGLSVIPSLKITDRGLVDVDRFEIVPLEA